MSQAGFPDVRARLRLTSRASDPERTRDPGKDSWLQEQLAPGTVGSTDSWLQIAYSTAQHVETTGAGPATQAGTAAAVGSDPR